jgi:hypothetical protein
MAAIPLIYSPGTAPGAAIVEAGFDLGGSGNVADWDNTESRERDEDAAWRALVAQFDTPMTEQQPVPWPEREDMPPRTQEPGGSGEAEGLKEAHNSDGIPGAEARYEGHSAEGPGSGREPDGGRRVRGVFDVGGLSDPEVIQVPRPIRGPAASGPLARRTPADDDDHYIPPAPPPLPRLDPMTKGAWAALFGGPGYLIVATAAGWSVPGIAAFCAVAAFVAGFAILVLRMNDPNPGGPDDGDDGAVV